MRMESRSRSAARAGTFAPGVLFALALSSCKVTNQSTSDPTANGGQAETVMSIQGTSSSDWTELIVYNDSTNSPTAPTSTCNGVTVGNPADVTYGCSTRSVCVGASLLGYSTASHGDTAFSYTHISPSNGVSVLWGDPAIAWSLSGQAPSSGWQYVYLSNLIAPSTKLPSGCQSGSMYNVMGGAAIYVSSDRGKTFVYLQTLSNAGHVYDGGTMTWSPRGYAMAAYADIDPGVLATDVWYVAGLGNFSRLGNPFAGCSACGSFDTHPDLRADSEGRFYVMAKDTNNNLWVTRTTTYAPPYSWTTPVQVTPNPVAGIPSSIAFSDVLGQPASLRLGKGFDFSIGNNESGVEELRFVYTFTFDGVSYRVLGGKCALGSSISGCGDVGQWNGHSVPGQPDYPVSQFNPLMAASHKGGSTPDIWAISYQSRQDDPTGNTVEHWQAQFLGGGSPSSPKKQDVGAEVVCPDRRDNGGFWGDYDSLVYVGNNNGEETFLRPYSDSTDGGGCVSSNPKAFRWTYRAGPLHVSMTQITIP